MIPLTPELAELCGIIAGDGHLSRYISPRRTDYRIEIVGNKEEDIAYFDHINSLFFRLFGKRLTFKQGNGCARLYIHSKEILSFIESLGIPVGKKSDIVKIPPIFLQDMPLTCHFIRGLADTDFSITFKKGGRKNNSYPRIVGEFASHPLYADLIAVFDKLGLVYFSHTRLSTSHFGTFTHYCIELNGRKNLKQWMKCIGFSNPKHLSKIALWQKQGFCQPKTTHRERMKIIEGMSEVVPIPS